MGTDNDYRTVFSSFQTSDGTIAEMYSSPTRRFLGKIRRELLYWVDVSTNLKCKRMSSAYYLPDGFKRIYHFHVRKTGGTSINAMFLALTGGDGQSNYRELNSSLNHRIIDHDKVFLGWNPRLINQGHYFYAFSHLPAHQLTLPPNTFTITCLRDPIKRLTSLFNMLKEQQDEGGTHPGFKFQKPYLRESFFEFVQAVPEEERYNQLYMFSRDLDIKEAVDNIKQCNVYFFSDTFNEGIETINKKLGLRLTPIHLRAGRHSETLDAIAIKKLKKMLEPEYELIDTLRNCA
jgi:Sulfotransferase family